MRLAVTLFCQQVGPQSLLREKRTGQMIQAQPLLYVRKTPLRSLSSTNEQARIDI